MTSFVFPQIPGQRGMATTQQLLDAGATLGHLQHLVRTGRRILRTVYSDRPGPLPEADLLVAASLWAGPRSVLTGVHALQAHGFGADQSVPIIPFLVPATCRTRVRAAGIETIRTKRLPRPVLRDDLRIAPVERALSDAARLHQLTDRQLRGIALSLLQQRRVTADRLADEIEKGRANATGGLVQAVVDFRRGAWSVPEAQLSAAVRAHPRLPAMLVNPRLVTTGGDRIGTPDGFFPDAGVVVQVHSKLFHTGTDEDGVDRYAATLVKDLEYQKHGILVVPVAPTTLRDDLGGFVQGLVDVVTRRLGWRSDTVRVA